MEGQAAEVVVEYLSREDVDKGVVRLDEEVMQKLGLSRGDVVEIEGSRRTVARVWPGYEADRGRGVLRVDRWALENAGLALGSKARVRKVSAPPAKLVRLNPSQELKVDVNLIAYVRHRLLGRALVEGDKVAVQILGQAVPFEVVETEPKGPVFVDEMTSVEVFPFAALKVLLVSPSHVKLGGRVAVAGAVEPPLKGVAIRLTIRKPKSGKIVRTLASDEEGVFVDMITADEEGPWLVKAQTRGCESWALFLVEG